MPPGGPGFLLAAIRSAPGPGPSTGAGTQAGVLGRGLPLLGVLVEDLRSGFLRGGPLVGVVVSVRVPPRQSLRERAAEDSAQVLPLGRGEMLDEAENSRRSRSAADGRHSR
jgi:hypothetical protein